MNDSPQFTINESRTLTKKKILNGIKNDCKLKITVYKSKYKKLKKIDNILSLTSGFLNSASIACIVSGLSFPPLLFISIGCSSTNFILDRVSEKANLKSKIESIKQTINQLSSITNEILVVSTKNNLSSDQYSNYIGEITEKINMIEEYSLII